jgi:hypothetical protein
LLQSTITIHGVFAGLTQAQARGSMCSAAEKKSPPDSGLGALPRSKLHDKNAALCGTLPMGMIDIATVPDFG